MNTDATDRRAYQRIRSRLRRGLAGTAERPSWIVAAGEGLALLAYEVGIAWSTFWTRRRIARLVATRTQRAFASCDNCDRWVPRSTLLPHHDQFGDACATLCAVCTRRSDEAMEDADVSAADIADARPGAALRAIATGDDHQLHCDGSACCEEVGCCCRCDDCASAGVRAAIEDNWI